MHLMDLVKISCFIRLTSVIALKELMKQITKGVYAPISKDYSDDLRQLINELLTKNPEVRPSIREILQKEFLNVSL